MLYNELDLCKKILEKGDSDLLVSLHRYASNSGIKSKTRKTAYRKISVEKDKQGSISFKYSNDPYLDENILSNSYSLIYKNCKSDSSKSRRYYFGDIKIPVKDSKLFWSKNDKKDMFKDKFTSPASEGVVLPDFVKEFNTAFFKQLDIFWDFVETTHESVKRDPKIECLTIPKKSNSNDLKNYNNLFFHFDFTQIYDIQQWYELDEVLASIDRMEIENTLLENYEYNKTTDRYSLLKSLIHTVTSGADNSDNQFVGFSLAQRDKTLSLVKEDLRSLFYLPGILKNCEIRSYYINPYFFRLIPVGEDIGYKEIKDYFEDIKSISLNNSDSVKSVESAEENVKIKTSSFDLTDLVSSIVLKCSKNIVSFDLILVKSGSGVNDPDTNVCEINNLSHSFLRKTLKNIRDTIEEVKKTRHIPINSKFPLSVFGSFYDIHKSVKKGEKYQMKGIKMMLRLYRGAYYEDSELDKIFLETVLHDIREEDIKGYYSHKTSYVLLKNLSKEVSMSKSADSLKSDELGKCLARVCWPLKFVKNSFEKSQVGYISDRANSLTLIRRLFNEYDTSVKLHQGESLGLGNDKKVQSDGLSYHEAYSIICEFEDKGMELDRDAFCMGFLDEYNTKTYFASKN